MADIYVSSAGSNTAPYDTWAKAATTLSTAMSSANNAPGDTIYVSSTHSESAYGASTTLTSDGTYASPMRIIVGSTSAAPPTTIGSGVVISTGNGAYSLTMVGNYYCYGLTFRNGVGNSANNSAINLSNTGGNAQVYEQCSFEVATTVSNSNSKIMTGSAAGQAAPSSLEWRNCTVKFGSAAQVIDAEQAIFAWNGGSILSGSAAITTLFNSLDTSGRAPNVTVCGVDLSNAASTLALVNVTYLGRAFYKFVDCNLPASWAGTLITGSLSAPGQRVEMFNCDSGDTNYRIWIEDYAGSIVQSTSVYNDAGATDGTTRLSWLMTASANAEYPVIILRSPEIVKWNETTGSAITCTVEIVHNSQGSGTNGVLNDDECWLEVMYLGTSGAPLGTWITDCKANVLATAAAQDTSSAAWTGDSAGWDTQKLSVTFTPQEKGFIHARVVVAKASATVYVDPLITVS